MFRKVQHRFREIPVRWETAHSLALASADVRAGNVKDAYEDLASQIHTVLVEELGVYESGKGNKVKEPQSSREMKVLEKKLKEHKRRAYSATNPVIQASETEKLRKLLTVLNAGMWRRVLARTC